MSKAQDEFVDAWGRSTGAIQLLPEDAELICAYGVYFVVDTIDETAFFRRADDQDELWIASWITVAQLPESDTRAKSTAAGAGTDDAIGAYCAIRLTAKGSAASACARLLDRLIRARVGFGWPDGFLRAGIINATKFKRIVESIETELERNTAQARSGESELVAVARELELHPEPTGTSGDHWRANCPGTQHFIEMRAAKNSFYCGYCQRRGGADELHAFVQERKARARGANND